MENQEDIDRFNNEIHNKIINNSFKKSQKTIYYAVAIGKKPGIYLTWKECQEQVLYYRNSKYKKFTKLDDAKNYILNINNIVLDNQIVKNEKY